MSAQFDQSDVLIIGAGPTGLTLACTLAQRGVRFRIVDASATPPIGSRGKKTQPRSLELFDDLGLTGLGYRGSSLAAEPVQRDLPTRCTDM